MSPDGRNGALTNDGTTVEDVHGGGGGEDEARVDQGQDVRKELRRRKLC